MTLIMCVVLKNRHNLKSKEIKIFQNELKNYYDDNFFNKKSFVEIAESEGLNIIFVDNEPDFMLYKNKIFFTLHGLNRYKPNKKFVVVDMGAVKFVANGADVMAPGIVDAERSISKFDPVWICDEKHRKPLAVGIAIMNSEEMINKNKGKAVRIIHYVGDDIWNFTSKSK